MQLIRAHSRLKNPVVLRKRGVVKIVERDAVLATVDSKPSSRFHLRRQFKVVWPDGSRERLVLDVYHPASDKNSCVTVGSSARPGTSPSIRTSPYKKFGGRGRLVRGGRCQFDRLLKEQASWAGIGNGSYTKHGEIVLVERSKTPEPDLHSHRVLIDYWREGLTPQIEERLNEEVRKRRESK